MNGRNTMREKNEDRTSVQTKSQFIAYRDGLKARGLMLPTWWNLMEKKTPTPEDLNPLHIWVDE